MHRAIAVYGKYTFNIMTFIEIANFYFYDLFYFASNIFYIYFIKSTIF